MPMPLDFEKDPLAWLVAPMDPGRFVSQHLEKKHLIAGEPDAARFRDLLSLEDLDVVLGQYGVRFPDVRLVRHEDDLPHQDYVYKDNLVDPMRVARLFAEGATVIFGGLHDRHEPVRRLCTAVSQRASLKTQANIYLTPPHSQGFDAHWDTHDVFVLQIEGTKEWRIYDGGPEHPLGGQKFDPEKHSAGAVTDEFTLRAGQILYIPRGVMHAAAATDDVSLHITLGVICYTWSELLSDCLAELLERSPTWRENLPLGFGAEPDMSVARLEQELRARLSGFVDQVDVREVVSSRMQQVENQHRPRVGDHLRQALASAALSDEHVVERRPGLPSRLELRGDRAIVRSGEREVSFPATAHRTLEQVLAQDSIPVASIDDDLDAGSRRTVIATLIREGIIANLGNRNSVEVTHGQ